MKLRREQIAAVAQDHSLRALGHLAQPPAFIPHKALLDELPRKAVVS